ncbi:MAG TPA: hypothetical protein VMT35_06555 [Ignavibacteriaceae bacterium]|nr:hypothetical protein [Ignavibacteriaceae bacterium]
MQKYSLSSLLPIYLLQLFFISSIILLSGCSSSKDTDGTSFVTGQIQMVSNEPFAKLGLVNDATLYLLDCSKEMDEILYNNQGKFAKIYYSSVNKNDEGIKVLKVVNAEILTGRDSK